MTSECSRCDGQGWYGVWARSAGGGHIEAQEQCEACNGTGIMPESEMVLVLCERCGSEGRLYTQSGNDPDSERDEGECPECQGTGRAFVPAEPIELEDLDA